METNQLLSIAKEFGSPVYVYNAERIICQVNRLKKAFKTVESLKIHYAVKALSNLSILKLLKQQEIGLDTVSIQEVRLGLEAGFSAQEIMYTPNGVSFKELEKAVELGCKITIDNLSVLEQFGACYPNYPVSVRINPHVMAGGNNNISVGHIDSKFGISIHQIPHVIRVIDNTEMKINGVHMHTGSDILDIDVFLYAAEILFDVAKQFPNLEFIDFGSGFKVAYKENDIATDIERLGKRLSRRFIDFEKEYGKQLDLIFEPGKFLVSEAGNFLVKVNVVKQTTSTVFAGVDSGFNHLMRPMLYKAHHDIINLSNPNGKERFYSVVGYICETDTFASNRRITEITEDDILCIKNAGAYCFSMASNYNSRYRPAEVLWFDNKAYLIRKRENFQDLLLNQVLVDLPQFQEELV